MLDSSPIDTDLFTLVDFNSPALTLKIQSDDRGKSKKYEFLVTAYYDRQNDVFVTIQFTAFIRFCIPTGIDTPTLGDKGVIELLPSENYSETFEAFKALNLNLCTYTLNYEAYVVDGN